MPFPDAPRVLYASNPLDQVICQLRFPPVLRIDAEPPAGFQEQIRADYPFYESKPALRLPPGIPADVAQLVAPDLPFAGQKSHVFGSRDRVWNLTLTREFLALTCRAYERWERFRDRLAGPFEALLREYRPAFFTRIGLRYRDVIRRSRLGLVDTSWSELLEPWVSGLLGKDEVAGDVEDTRTACLLRLPEGWGRVQLNYGLAIEERDSEPNREVVFLIDADFYTQEQTESPHVRERLDHLNRQSGLLFRTCIRDRLHLALGPRPVPPA
jgi:uncharacterized protein (TIGR04255 family)